MDQNDHKAKFAKSSELAKRVWVAGPKTVGQKSKNNRAEILPQKAKNQCTENMIRPKK